jgi:hypothetical protein
MPSTAASVLAALGVAALACSCSPAPPASRHIPAAVTAPAGSGPAITMDGARPGPLFQGIGAISGGGGNSRLLIDYPEPERSQILDYLFSPHYGASLQLLKLEIGGDANSTDGAEPSIEQVSGDLDCGTGYEFWLARQAVARNPAIRLYGLQWAAPSWVRSGRSGIWSRADVRYVISWLSCARSQGLHISYLGGWNEHYRAGASREAAWYIELRAALNANGFGSTQIVAADARSWRVASAMAADPALDHAVAVIGAHDTCGYPTGGFACTASAQARQLSASQGKPLWESELGATPATGSNAAAPGPAGLARAAINAYRQAGVTGILVWPLLNAMPPDLPHEDRGLVRADHPWDGSYTVSPLTWVIAQTTQFTAAGWRLVGGGSGRLPGGGHGSYVSYQAPGRTAWTLVAQTSTARRPQRVAVHVTGGLPAAIVHVWSTSVTGHGLFIRRRDIKPVGGTFSVTLLPGQVYTLTTTTGQSKAGGRRLRVPAAGPMPVRYTSSADQAGMARLLSPMEGSFQYTRGVLTQTTVGEPVEWHDPGRDPAPYAVTGWKNWRNYTVSARVQLPPARQGSPAPGASLIARFSGYPYTATAEFGGYQLTVNEAGRWQIVRHGRQPAVLAAGRVAASRSYALRLNVRGHQISASVDGAAVATVTDTRFTAGPAGLGSLGYYPVRYHDFSVRPVR